MEQKVVVITGGFGTLGLALAERAIKAGARVALVDIAAGLQTGLTSRQADNLVLYPGTDLQDPDRADSVIAAILGKFGRIDALANVAGGFVWETLRDGGIATWDRMFGQNLRTAAIMSRAVVPSMIGQGAGAIVNVGANGALKAGAGMGAYAASKAAVHRLTEAMAEELKDAGVRVNAVLPSIIDTAANRKDMPDADFSTWVSPDALARIILFLCSDEASAITGALLPVTGRV